MTNEAFLSVPQGEKSGRRMVVKGNTFFPVGNSSLCHHREWGFGEARTGVSEPRSLEVFAHFAEEKLRPGRGYLVGLPQQIRHKGEPRTPVSCSGLCPTNQGRPGWDQCEGWKERDRTWL